MAKKKSKGSTSHELANKHIKDKNHQITEEEFSNLEVGGDLRLEDEKPLELPEHNRPKDEDKDPKTITPWDVLKDSQS